MYHKWDTDGAKANRFKVWCIREDQTYTAMAKTVGFTWRWQPASLNGKITTPGVQLYSKEVYNIERIRKRMALFLKNSP
jgi:hypothetical protein